MEYNTGRPNLLISEYGRNVQKMIQLIKEMPTKEERTLAAHTVINIMTWLNPQVREQNDWKQKLWDHLFLIAGYDLDVDSPFPKPNPLEALARPDKPSYSSNHIKYRYYGKNVERMLQKVTEMEPGPARDHFVNAVASLMKMSYRVWNNEDKVPDEIIINHVSELTGGKIQLTSIQELLAHGESFNQPRQKKMMGKHNKHKKQKKKKFRK